MICLEERSQTFGVTKTIRNWEYYGVKPQVQLYKAIIDFIGLVPIEKGDSVGEQIWFYRAVYGLSHRDLAKQFGLDEGTIIDWENNKSKRIFGKIKKAFERIGIMI